MKNIVPSFIIIIFLLLSACQPSTTSNNNDENKDTTTTKNESYNKKVKKIFYTVPSPIEMTNMLQKAGSEYDASLLNPEDNLDKYLTVSQQALNLGIYGADLSYNRMFDQIQSSINYLVVLHKISDKLGVPEDEGAFALNRIEDNIEDKDSVMQIIAETYANADAYFKENDMPNIAALILIGGWTEGIYIALNVAKTAKKKQLVLERVAEQKLSLDNLIELMKEHTTDESINHYLPKFVELKEIFDKVNISYSSGTVETDTVKKMTVISGTSTVDINEEEVSSIENKILEIRKEMIL